MSWIVILGIAVVAIALVALSGIKVKGGRPAGRTHLMTAARICLGLLVLVVLLAFAGVFK
ncbi:MAG: hypothetical protein M3O15_00535 [Acidobacteriota bacterium]|nr:hypothetical protein [Acidobacteriota bacterium]